MPEKCPTSVRPGHQRRTDSIVRRLFVFLMRIFRQSQTTESASGHRIRHSNAEYHLTRSQLRRVIAAASSPRDHVLLRLFVETGIRRTEAATIKFSDIRADEQLLLIRNGKGGKLRLVPLTTELTRELMSLSRHVSDDFVFPGRNGRPLSPRQINRIVAEAGKRAGVQNPNPAQQQITCHLFRHSFARLWKQHNGSIETLSKVLGHASQRTTWDLYGTEGLSDVQTNYRKMMRKLDISQQNQEDQGETKR